MECAGTAGCIHRFDQSNVHSVKLFRGGLQMKYKVVVVSTRNDCCNSSPGLDHEVQDACNHMASRGYVLVTAYPENVKDCCNQVKRAVFLIFAHPEE